MNNLGITSLVLIVIAVLFGTVFFLSGLFIFIPLIAVIFVVSIVLSILSLRKSKNIISIISLVLSIIGILIILYPTIMIFRIFQPQVVYSFEVPIKISINTYDFDIKEISDTDKIDLFIFAEEPADAMHENCIPEYFMYGGVYSPLRLSLNKTYTGNYRGSIKEFPLECAGIPGCQLRYYSKLGSSISKTYLLKLDDDKWGSTKKSLKSENDLFYLEYSIVPALGDPDYTRDINTSGCFFSYDAIGGIAMDTRTLEVNKLNGKESSREKEIICVKQFHGHHDYAGKYSKNYCTFFEVSFDIDVEYEIELDQGEHVSETVPLHI
jgi:hypothetical protein